MLAELIQYTPYLMIGLGVGYLVTLGVIRGPTLLDYKKERLEMEKERLRTLSRK